MCRRKQNHKKLGIQLNRRYKDAIRKHLEKELYVLSDTDINNHCMKIESLKENDRMFDDVSHASTTYKIYSDSHIQNGYVSTSLVLLLLLNKTKNNYLKECYIYPILFCFRQYLELTMKDSILFFREKRSNAFPGESNLDGHDLLNLWKNLYYYLDCKDIETKSVYNIIKEINDIDKKGELFRYGYSLTKKIHAKNIKMPLIDMHVLYERILQLYRFFEGINDEARIGYEDKINANN